MASFSAIYSVGDSLVSYLRHAYELAYGDADLPACKFELVHSSAMGGGEDSPSAPVQEPGVSLYLYRVAVNEHMRNEPRTSDNPPSLSLDLHYLLTVWADNAKDEHRILAWTMQRLHTHQALSQSDLTPDGGWKPGELVQIIPAEISLEELTRIWDTLRRPYRPSLSYVARVVRIDVDGGPVGRPVVARRLTFTDQGGES